MHALLHLYLCLVSLCRSQPGNVVKPGKTMAIPNEGMPKHRNPFDKGSLLIVMDVEMPDTLSADVLKQLSKVPGLCVCWSRPRAAAFCLSMMELQNDV